ncbi:hypothetical protein A3B60_01540 [Candidatus Peregrinibacteria bacterium RIFCSPLOWO2_01_FULL_39_12]|nr:MAG: hypothetical protein A3B60_01540 [Candidatus Peregrinibacteria bacterium RIFCSPLOWO2_01_FULL_39_12]OGJ43438.1 MAG: hypothetical protein A3I58_02880 [Candidatus Peregrinibacteria bacterium RIFCSPLOWO2_02_FULL_39_10]
MNKQLIVDLSGGIDLGSHGRMYLNSPEGTDQVVLMSPKQIDLFSRAVPGQNLEIQKLVKISEIARACSDKITDLTDAVVLINTLGGTDTMRVTLEWIREIIKGNHGRMISVVAQDAQSLGAIAARMTDEILCLRGSRFLWHTVRNDPRFGLLDEIARVNGMSPEENLEIMRAKNRQVILYLLVFLTKSGNPIPKNLRKRLISSLYVDEEAFEEDVKIVGQFQRGEVAKFTAEDLYKPDGVFTATGREFEQANLVVATTTVEELVQEVRRRGLNVAFPSLKTLQDKFFVVAELNERARARSLKVEFFIDKDGDVSVKSRSGFPDEKQKRNLRRAVSMVQELLGKVGTMEYELLPS